jgi:2'-5' RNA ligase
MLSEIPSLVRVGSRCYRQFAVSSFAPSCQQYKSEKAHLLLEDDGESEDEENINVDVSDFETSGQKKLFFNSKVLISETINFNPASGLYWLDLPLNPSNFNLIWPGSSSEKTHLQKQLENEFKVVLKGSPSVFSLEIKAHSHEHIIKAHKSLIERFGVSKPDEYIVKSDKVLAVVPAEQGTSEVIDEEALQTEEDLVEEYPKLEIVFNTQWKGFMTVIHQFPKECVGFLLAEKGKIIKKLKSEMKGNVEYQLNRNEGSLEIIGWTEEQVKQGYACFIRALKNDRAIEAFIALKQDKGKPPLKRAHDSSKPQQKDPARGFQQKEVKNSQPREMQRDLPRAPQGNQRKFTHFLSVNLENNLALVNAQKEIHSALPSLCPFMEILPNRFHVTLAMLSLENTNDVINALNEVKEELKAFNAGSPIELTFDRPGFFGKPTEANVLFLGLNRNKELNRLSEVTLRVLDHLIRKGVLMKEDLRKQSTEIRGKQLNKIFHLTLAKSKGSAKTIDVTPVIDSKRFNIKCFATQIDLMSLNTNSTNSSYPILHSIKIV